MLLLAKPCHSPAEHTDMLFVHINDILSCDFIADIILAEEKYIGLVFTYSNCRDQAQANT